jgi:dTDP-4-amino-4,6-dideoxygalactose transaminase
MTNIQAAILCDQLDVLSEILEKKQSIFNRYRKAFENRDDIKLQKITLNTQSSNWMFALRIPGASYEVVEKYLYDKNIDSRPMFYPLSYHKHLKNHSDIDLSGEVVSEILSKECLMIPCYPDLSTIETDYIIKVINNFIKGK